MKNHRLSNNNKKNPLKSNKNLNLTATNAEDWVRASQKGLASLLHSYNLVSIKLLTVVQQNCFG